MEKKSTLAPLFSPDEPNLVSNHQLLREALQTLMHLQLMVLKCSDWKWVAMLPALALVLSTRRRVQ